VSISAIVIVTKSLSAAPVALLH